jgi:YebC/PmpR family DNA-binding regulatory protein
MAGHSKWANIKHKKAKEDASRGKAFTKLIKEITVVARDGGGDPSGNPRLRTLIDKAKQINMPQENIKRAIKKGTGELAGVAYEHMMYEGYGPSGVAIMLEVLTDNKNRAVASVRSTFTKKGGNLAENGSVSWMFSQKGVIKATNGSLSEDDLLEKLIDFDVDDIHKTEDGLFYVTCAMKALEQVKQGITKAGLTVESAEVEWVAKDKVDVAESDEEKVYDFLDALENLEDIQNVYSNVA